MANRQDGGGVRDGLVSRDRDWGKEIKQLTGGKGYQVAFDPIAAGDFLNTEIRLLGQGRYDLG